MAAFLGAVLGVGALVFAATSLRGSHDDVRYVVFWVRRFAVMGVLGGGVEIVAAGAVWAGGVVALALVARRRWMRSGASDLLALAVRFSVVASAAVVAAGVAGVVLTMVIIDDLSTLWSTPWGRVLLVKVGLVVVAGSLGLHNHRTLIPRYLDAPQSATFDGGLRRAALIEAVILVAVVATTGLLVASSAVEAYQSPAPSRLAIVWQRT